MLVSALFAPPPLYSAMLTLPPFPLDVLLLRHCAGEDMRKLDAGVHVVSGTPGRVKDMMERQKLRTRHIKVGQGPAAAAAAVSFWGGLLACCSAAKLWWQSLCGTHTTHEDIDNPHVDGRFVQAGLVGHDLVSLVLSTGMLMLLLTPAIVAAVLLCACLLLQLLVLDEADEMLSMNFTEQIYNCYRYLPPDCQVS
jgi:hypothetical protein